MNDSSLKSNKHDDPVQVDLREDALEQFSALSLTDDWAAARLSNQYK